MNEREENLKDTEMDNNGVVDYDAHEMDDESFDVEFNEQNPAFTVRYS